MLYFFTYLIEIFCFMKKGKGKIDAAVSMAIIYLSYIWLYIRYYIYTQQLFGQHSYVFVLLLDQLSLTFQLCLESSEAHSEENKASQDNKKRRLKTPSQVMALEKFYNGKNASLVLF